MTDEELLAVVQNKTPEELSPDEVAALRTRLAQSEPLRKALFETLQMESYLTAALSPVEVSADRIVAKVEQERSERQKTLLWAGITLASVVLLLLGYGGYSSLLRRGPVAVAPDANDPGQAAKPQPAESAPSSVAQPNSVAADTPATIPNTGESKKPETSVPAVAVVEAPKPITPPPKDPWYEIMQVPAAELPSFAEVCFHDFPYRSVLPRADDIAKWFEAVPGREFRVLDGDTKRGKCGKFEGFARLRAPLPGDGGFRFAAEGLNRVAIYAYHGQQGAMLVYYEDLRNRWSAYTITRKPGESKPETIALTATDAERARRAEVRYGGPLELRYHNGELLLMRGDIVLVSAPLAEAPTEVYFEGRPIFEGLEISRTKDLSLPREIQAERIVAEPAEAKPAETLLKPAELAWKEKLAGGAAFQKQDDQSVKLTSTDGKESSYVFAPIPGVGFREVIFELRDVAGGFGVYLGNDDEQIRQLVRFVRDNRNKRMIASFRGADNYFEGDFPPPLEQAQMACNSKVWVKLLYGTGCLKWWLSTDGKHWALGDQIPEQYEGRITSLGLTTCRTPQETGGTLVSVAVRELSAINQLASAELVQQAPPPQKRTTFEAWLADAVESCPPHTALDSWRRAYAVRSLGFGMPRDVAQKILEALLDEPITRALPIADQLAVLREVMQVETDPRDTPDPRGGGWKKGYITRFQELGRESEQQGGLAFSTYRLSLMQTPTFTVQPLPVTAGREVEQELVQLLERDRSTQALEFCGMLQLFHFNENRPLVAWAETVARRAAGRNSSDASRVKDAWRPPLVEELNKEVYNFASDLHSIVESGALDDASRMIASLEADRGGGLTPSGSDPELFVSLSVAVKLAIAQQPALQQLLSTKLGPLAGLRVRQAIASGDQRIIELAATQFAGTEAAADAYRWLGDRALQNGWFARALADYRRAGSADSSGSARELAPRARLAAAMMGLDEGQPVAQAVAIGESHMSAAEFEALVTEMKARGVATVRDAVASVPGKLPAPLQVVPQNRARFDGPVGQNPHEDGARMISQLGIDYAGRQLAVATEGDTMYVSNRFQIAAYQATSGQRLWQSQVPPGELRRGQDWPLIPMQPLVAPATIYARQLYGKSPSLCAFERAAGKLLWQAEGTETLWWVSDPLFVQGQLLALNVLRDGNREMQLRLASLDPASGEILSQRRLVGLRESWQQHKCCEVLGLDDGLIASVGGFTLRCDAEGNLRWLRKQLLLPAEERPEWIRQYFQPPILHNDRVLALQPGVETLDCVDAGTGKRLWSFLEERPHRIFGVTSELIVLQTDSGVIALRWNDGGLAWRHAETAPRLTAAMANEQYVLYGIRRGATDKPKVPELVWLETATGKLLGSTELTIWQDNDPRIGPLVATKDRLWTFFGKEKDPNRDVAELTLGAAIAAQVAVVRSPWQRMLPPTLAETLADIAPQWEVVCGYQRPGAEKKASWQGENDAALVLARPEVPVVLAAQPNIPAGKHAKLNLRLGHESNPPGELVVMADGERIFTHEWKPDNANRWDSLSFDLTKFGGRSVVVSLSYHPSAGNDHALWLKSAQIVVE